MDKELEYVRAAKKGDANALNYLFTNYKPIIYQRLGVYFMKGSDTEDMIQEGMIGLFYAIKKFDESMGIEFGKFAKICVQRQMIDAVRLSTRKKHIPLNDYVSINASKDEGENDDSRTDYIQHNNICIHDDPEEIVMAMETVEKIRELIKNELTPLEEKVLALHLKGESYSEIAQKLGKNSKSIDNAVQRARKKIDRGLR